MQILEPIILAKFSESLVGQMKPTEAIKFMCIIGYSTKELKSQKIFECALKDLIKQVKYN